MCEIQRKKIFGGIVGIIDPGVPGCIGGSIFNLLGMATIY